LWRSACRHWCNDNLRQNGSNAGTEYRNPTGAMDLAQGGQRTSAEDSPHITAESRNN
jgi:hypothetical protein